MTTQVKCDEGTFELGEPCTPVEALADGYWFSAFDEDEEPEYLTRINRGCTEHWSKKGESWNSDHASFLNPHRAIRVQDKPEPRPLDQAARDWMRARPGEVLIGGRSNWRFLGQWFQVRPHDEMWKDLSKDFTLDQYPHSAEVLVTPACGSWDIPPAPVEPKDLDTPEVRRWMMETGRSVKTIGTTLWWDTDTYAFCYRLVDSGKRGTSHPFGKGVPEDGLPW